MRLIRGRDGWWCITRAGTALIPASLMREGQLSAEGRRQVSEAGLDRALTPDHYSLTVVTTTQCNLGCSYCFQNVASPAPGTFAPPRIAQATLGPDTLSATAAFAARRMAEQGVSTLAVALFGGEPLLNAAGCLAVLRACDRRVHTVGSMISNGVLMTGPLAVRLAAAGLRAVQVTLDGPRALHDVVRTTRAGRGTFDVILANVAAAQEQTDLDITLRVNVTAAALPGIEELLRGAAAVTDPARTRFALGPVLSYGTGSGEPAGSGRPETLPAPDADRAAVGQAVRAYAVARELGFKVAPPRDDHCDFCSVPDGRYGAVVNADGALFSCWESVGRPGYAVGTVADGYDDYPAGRWVTCGSLARNGPALGRFADALDAGLLDLLRR